MMIAITILTAVTMAARQPESEASDRPDWSSRAADPAPAADNTENEWQSRNPARLKSRFQRCASALELGRF